MKRDETLAIQLREIYRSITIGRYNRYGSAEAAIAAGWLAVARHARKNFSPRSRAKL